MKWSKYEHKLDYEIWHKCRGYQKYQGMYISVVVWGQTISITLNRVTTVLESLFVYDNIVHCILQFHIEILVKTKQKY